MEVEATGDEDDEKETAATEEEFKEEDLDELEAMKGLRRKMTEMLELEKECTNFEIVSDFFEWEILIRIIVEKSG